MKKQHGGENISVFVILALVLLGNLEEKKSTILLHSYLTCMTTALI